MYDDTVVIGDQTKCCHIQNYSSWIDHLQYTDEQNLCKVR